MKSSGHVFVGFTPYVERASEFVGVEPNGLGELMRTNIVQNLGRLLANGQSHDGDTLRDFMASAERYRNNIAALLLAIDFAISDEHKEHDELEAYKPLVYLTRGEPTLPATPQTQNRPMTNKEKRIAAKLAKGANVQSDNVPDDEAEVENDQPGEPGGETIENLGGEIPSSQTSEGDSQNSN